MESHEDIVRTAATILYDECDGDAPHARLASRIEEGQRVSHGVGLSQHRQS